MPESVAKSGSVARHGHLRAVRDADVQAAHPALLAACADVSNVWIEVLKDSFDANEIRDVIEWLMQSVDAAARDREPLAPVGSLPLGRFLVERLSSSLLRQLEADATVDRAEILALLRGVDATRQVIAPDWDRYFASQISGPDGLNLVLEVAHDLRSPLTSIRCLAETIERGQSGPVTDLQRKQLRLIYSASLGLGSMATDVIEMARRGDQLVDGEAEPFSLSAMLEGVADMVRPIAEEKGVAFAFQSVANDHRIGMPIILSRVLLNLVTNGLKFTDEGRVDVQLISTSLSRVEFVVADTGRGIPDSAVPDLFRPFRRTTARMGRSGYMFSGTGLGLALCRKLLRSMGSELRFDTVLGEGTRFRFELDLPPASRL